MNFEELKEEDFKDPISLLKAISADTKNLQKKTTINIDNKYLSLYSISRIYGLSEDYILSLIDNGRLVPIFYVPYFDETSIQVLLNNKDIETVSEIDSLIYEIEHMKMNYSYKPLFLLAIFEMGEKGVVFIDDVVRYFISYYSQRMKSGEIPEKADSTFVKYVGDFKIAKSTIIKYPVEIYKKKGFISYDKEKGFIRLNKRISSLLSTKKKQRLSQGCIKKLEEYYAHIE